MKQLQQLQDRIHGPRDWSGTSLMTTSGSMEGMSAVCDSILNEKDVVILPIPVYAGSADMVRLEYGIISFILWINDVSRGAP